MTIETQPRLEPVSSGEFLDQLTGIYQRVIEPNSARKIEKDVNALLSRAPQITDFCKDWLRKEISFDYIGEIQLEKGNLLHILKTSKLLAKNYGVPESEVFREFERECYQINLVEEFQDAYYGAATEKDEAYWEYLDSLSQNELENEKDLLKEKQDLVDYKTLKEIISVRPRFILNSSTYAEYGLPVHLWRKRFFNKFKEDP